MGKKLKVSKNITLSSGSGYYDVNYSFPIEELEEIIEEVGVRGGHIGWQIKLKTMNGYDFGRNHHGILSELLDYVKKEKLKVKHTILKDRPTKCY